MIHLRADAFVTGFQIHWNWSTTTQASANLDDAEFVLSKFYVPTWNALLHKINGGETDKAFLAASSGGARVHPVLVDDEHACEPDLFAPCRRRRTRWC